MDSVDLQSKYQTLAAEYSKVTAKCTVLKKAVLEEQAKNVDLKEQLTETDRHLRQQRQEVDSLSFRNEQLTRRVGVLQGDLELDHQSKHAKKKGGGKSPAHEPAVPNNLNVLEEELMSKINENVRLNEQLSEAEARHQEEVGSLTSRVHQLEAQLLVKSAPPPPTPPPRSPASTDSSQQPRAAACTDCERRRTEARAAQARLLQVETERRQLTDQLTAAEAAAAQLSRRVAEYAPLVDTELPQLDRLNVPCGRRAEQRRAAVLSAEVGCHLSELTAALANYHSYCEQRLHALSPHGLSAVRDKLSALLLSHRFSLSPVPAALQRVTEALRQPTPLCPQTLVQLTPLAEAVRNYHVFLDRVVSFQRLSLQEETALDASGHQYLARLAAVASVFGRLQTCLDVLAKQASCREQPPVSNSRRLMQLLAVIFQDLHTALRELSKRYTLQMTEERDLATTSAELVTTNECILSSLVAATTAAQKLEAAWAAALPWVQQLSTVKFRTCSPDTGASAAVLRFNERAATYLTLLDGPAPARASLDQSLSGSLAGDAEEEAAARLERCQRSLTELEQSRERWRLEFQLIKAKYERLQACSAATPATDPSPSGDDESPRPPAGAVTAAGDPWADMAGREEALKAELMQQLDEMVVRLQTAEARSRHFQTECRHLVRSLTAVEETCTLVQRQLTDASAAKQTTQQELVTTAASYESQMAAMSDHLAGLNETLTSQRDQIDQLRYQLGQKKRGQR